MSDRTTVGDGGRATHEDGAETPAEDGPADAIDVRPPRETVVAASVAAFVAATATLLGSPIGGVVAFAGLGAFGFGVYRARERFVTLGALGLAAGVLVGGSYGAGAASTLAATAALVVAWEVARHGLSAAAHVGTDAVSRRSVLARTGIVGVATALTTGFVYAVYLLGAGGRPIGGVVLLVVGVTLVATAATARER